MLASVNIPPQCSSLFREKKKLFAKNKKNLLLVGAGEELGAGAKGDRRVVPDQQQPVRGDRALPRGPPPRRAGAGGGLVGLVQLFQQLAGVREGRQAGRQIHPWAGSGTRGETKLHCIPDGVRVQHVLWHFMLLLA